MSQAQAITCVVMSGSERCVPLEEVPCTNCGIPGCTHIFLSMEMSLPFCSWEHLYEAMRINDMPLTEELMKEAGVHIIGPRPEA